MKTFLTVLFLFFSFVPFTSAQIGGPVHVIDSSNLAKNTIQVTKAIEQIHNQIEQLRTMELNLRQIVDPSWREIDLFMLELNELVRAGEALGYSQDEIFSTFRFVTPGFLPIERGEFEEHYSGWTEIALDTLAATLQSARHQSLTYFSTQEQLGELQALSDSAEGNLEALQTGHMLQAHTAQEVAKLNQLLAANLNAHNVLTGVRLSIEAAEEASLRQAVDAAREPFIFYGNGGLSPVPGGWPFPCPACG